MKRHGNLFASIVDEENIYQAYKRAREGKTWMRAVKKFEANLEDNLKIVRDMLVNKTFTTSPYRIKYAYYPKFREIFIVPFAPDRIVQHALMAIVEPIWDKLLVDNTVSCRKGKGTEAAFKLAVKYVNTNKYCLKCDISKFYPSINHDILYSIIKRKIKCKDTLWLIKDIIYSYGKQFNTTVNSPIGNYTSQWFGNLYMDFLDRIATEEWKIDYLRYCDDFLFFSNSKEELQRIAEQLPSLLYEKRKLKLSKIQLFPTKNGLDFIGYRFFPQGYILLRKRVAKTVKRRIKKLNSKVAKGLNIQRSSHARGQLASTIGLLSRCNTHHLKLSTRFYRLVVESRIRPKKKCAVYYRKYIYPKAIS